MSFASGKLMIAGEYSVLFGGLALVSSCTQKLKARFEPSSSFEFYIRTSADFIKFDQHELCSAVFNTAQKYGLEAQKGSYFLDSSAFYRLSGHKLGLGSSAAASVALTKLLMLQHGKSAQSFLLKVAQEAHQDFSHKLSSGADIAAIVYEHSISYENTPQGPLIKPVELAWWPQIFRIDTGRAQNTRDFVKSVLENIKPELKKRLVRESNYCVQNLLSACGPHEIVEFFNRLYMLLAELGDSCSIDIISLEHRAIHELAVFFKGSAKPSGAGGADISIAWVSPENHDEFRTELKKMAFEIIIA